ncbi:MAG: choice-of-anchor Q domain-containing protein [Nitrosomonas ureae]
MFIEPVSGRRLPVLLRSILIFVVLMVGFSPSNAHALGVAIRVDTIADNTTEDGLCSLREAITNANINWQFYEDCDMGFSDDGIYFSDSLGTATITLTSALPLIKDPAGLVIDGGHDITISGGNLYQIFSVTPVGNLTLDSLTVRKGKSQITNIGGAVWNAGTLVIRNCNFRDNYAKYGGAIFNGVAKLNIIDSNFQDNKSSHGGGVYNEGGQVTIQGGVFYGNSAAEGGAIKNAFASGVLGSVLSINGTSFTQNISKYGAGVYNTALAQVNITDATFLKNNGGHAGGGIYNLGNLALNDSEISGNIAETGGGIYNQKAILNITGSILKSNKASEGAGIYNRDGQLNIESSEISENDGIGFYNVASDATLADARITNVTFMANKSHAIYNHSSDNPTSGARIWVVNSNISRNFGAGIYNDIGFSNIYTSIFQGNGGSGLYNIAGSLASIYKSSFLGNTAKFGGGIYNDDSDLFLSLSTLYENIAFQSGGGLYNNGAADILGSTISNNSANVNDGLYNASSGNLELYNTIIAKSGGLGVDCTNAPGGLIVGNNNLIQSTGLAACDFIDGVNSNIIGYDPSFEPLTGSPAYLPLGSTSPALDNGDDAKCFMALNQSQNGVIRPQGAHCDIGSYEAPASTLSFPEEMIDELSKTVQSLVDNGGLSTASGEALISILAESNTALETGDAESSIKLLYSFEDQVVLLIDSTEVKPDLGQELINKAQAIIDSMK